MYVGNARGFDLSGKSILVTGGTGSFGRAFVKRLIQDGQARRIIVFSRGEQRQYEMAHDPAICHSSVRFFIGDVRDEGRLDMATRGVDYIVHAAAMKHVPIAEYNPMECMKTNVGGAENVVTAAIRNKVKRVIALSTDKACNPINLYGASKLASDKVFVAANNLSGTGGTRFSVVRYGNVIGSNGSVLPLFRRLIAEGAEALPITDERMTRFWIAIEQGVEFVLSSMAIMRGGEIFVPKIPSMRITDLARSLAPNLPISIVGIRPGEKLHEAMISVDDARLTLDLGDRYVIEPSLTWWDRTSYTTDGVPSVSKDFAYTSDTNGNWMTGEQLIAMADASSV